MPEELTALTHVGPATAAVLEAADIEPGDISNRQVSHAQLIDVGVNPGVAARIRREHSLPWSFDGSGDDLDRRAEQVRGLQDGEREWVAASANGWDTTKRGEEVKTTTEDDSGWERRPWPTEPDPETEFEAEAEWRERSRPTPLSELPELDESATATLAEAGITSVSRLASCHPERVADSLGIAAETVRSWRAAARDHSPDGFS
ncbi:hypothetical protein RH831_07720 [Halodesulfurarchaeum sp. HSR-GB]|uniref:DUF7409 domain-containing protein n=1 Tax=Halodesulfurarchaeum sp. HSR-GB TaxID=3074077 RepID=UPI002854EE11|nr:helix-hairpin-helix domain-containing protein [Halodesulfurarchaeum sp. HSR-GB]MDR5657067.1 hypothetical protein [Halodesulfurarchaeum sp. HSR-GB]